MTKNPWNTAPTLESSHVLLRPTTMSDVDSLAAAYDDDDTFKFFPCGVESDPPSERSVAALLASGRQTLTQIDRLSSRVVGMTSMYNMSEQHGRVTVGFTWLSARMRGTGFNALSKRLLLDHIFSTLMAERVEFNVDNLNVRSRRAVVNLGASQEGALRNHARRRDGTWRTTVVYSILRDEWHYLRGSQMSAHGQEYPGLGPDSADAEFKEQRNV